LFVRSFVQIIFVQPLCCRNSDRSFDHSIVHRSFIVPIHHSSFVHSPYSSFVQIIFVLPYAVEIPIVRSSDHSTVCSFVRSFDRSFVRLSDHSIVCPFVHSSYSSFIVRSYDCSHHYLPLLFTITIHHHYSSLLFIIITIHCSSDHPQISTTHPSCCPVHLRPAKPMFQSYELW
jgi:hypothetical protein